MQWGKEYCLSAASQLNLSYMQALFLSIGLLWIWDNFSSFLEKNPKTKQNMFLESEQVNYIINSTNFDSNIFFNIVGNKIFDAWEVASENAGALA